VDTGLGFGHFSRDLIHDQDFSKSRLLHPGTSRFTGRLLAVAQVANLPDRNGVEIGSIV
jgi:hypothetical protein